MNFLISPFFISASFGRYLSMIMGLLTRALSYKNKGNAERNSDHLSNKVDLNSVNFEKYFTCFTLMYMV